MSFAWLGERQTRVPARRSRATDWQRSAFGYLITVGSVALALATTRLTWPALSRTPFVLLFSSTFVAARWGTETNSWLAVLLAIAGSTLVVPLHGTPALDARELLIFAAAAIVMNRIVVGRNRAVASLGASEARFRAMWENAGLGAALLDVNGQVASMNPAMERLLGHSSVASAGVSFLNFSHPDDAAAQRERFAALMASSSDTQGYTQEHRYRTADGTTMWCRVTMSPVFDEGGPRRGAVMILEDVTARRRAEEALRASERQYRRLFQDSPQAMWVYAPSTNRFLAVNEIALARYGYTREEFLPLALRDLHPVEERAAVDAVLGTEPEHTSHQTRHRTKDGRLLDVQVESHLVHWGDEPARLTVIADVTEQKALEARLRQTQRLEALGQLSGGLAHEFNNILTPIQGYSELLLAQIGPDKRIWHDLHEIQMAAVRASTLTSQLLAFSRREALLLRVVDVNAVVGGLTHLVRQLIREDIEIDIAPGAGSLHAKADVVQLEQMLLNLAINARDAVPRRGGRIAIRAWRADGRELEAGPNASAADWCVALEVADNGCGMDAQIQSRIFEPFFTTKSPEHGTGLGLAVVYGIVQEFGGRITVESEVGRGTTFRIYLPGTDEPVTADRTPTISPASLVGSEHILIVEDDAQLRRFVAQVLRRYGYRVLEAESAEDALALGDETAIDVMLTDVILPSLNGPQLAAHLKAGRPHLLVLYMSGHGAQELTQQGITATAGALLEKPFSAAELIARIRRLLDSRTVSSAQ